MMNKMPIHNAGLVFDLSVGKGELLWHAKRKWPTCSVAGFDIDQELVDHCESRFGGGSGTFKCVDTLRTNLQDLRNVLHNGIHTQTASLALSNPPFGTTKAEELAPDLLDTLWMHNLVCEDDTGGYQALREAAFLVRNLELVGNGGHVAILLPEGVVSGVKTESFRRFLLSHARVRLVLSLPVNSFDSSEARISLVLVQKKTKTVRPGTKIHLGSMDGGIESMHTLAVNQEKLLSRMDPRYHMMMARLENLPNDFKPFGGYLDSCARGHGFHGVDRSLLSRDGDVEYIHSIDMADFVIKESSHRLKVSSKLGMQHQTALVKKGDVLLARVGNGCAGRCAIVTHLTKAFASDCVYVLRSERIDPYYLCLYLNTSFAKEYLRACARGVCSRYITRADLMAMPLFLPDQEVIRRLSKAFKRILAKTSSHSISAAQLADISVLTNMLNTAISGATENGDRSHGPP